MKFAKREGVMLAYPADEKKILRMTKVQMEDGTLGIKMFHQPKLNGERSRTEWFAEHPYLISSYGNDFRFMEHIQDQLIKLRNAYQKPLPADGEVYVHGWGRERIDSALRRTKNRNPDTAGLQYHIFDLQSAGKQYERLHEVGILEQLIDKLRLDAIKIVPYGICGLEDWVHHCSCYCEDDYEGIILRDPFGEHETRRVPWMLKYKPSEEDEYEIVAVNEAVSKTGVPKNMVGSFTVRSIDIPDAVFNVGAGKLKHDKRIEYWQHKDRCIGKMLIVKHELLKTVNQVPIAAVTVDIKGGLR